MALELLYQVHGISITKLLIRVDVFYPQQGWSESPWKMSEAEVSGGWLCMLLEIHWGY